MAGTEWRRVLFLDVDGVLNSAAYFRAHTDLLHALDPDALQELGVIQDATGCDIVLSSTWRLVPEACEALRVAGVDFVDTTPLLSHTSHRGEEIATYLRSHRNINTFAIVDDDADAGDGFNLAPHFVRTDWNTGLTREDTSAIIAILGGTAP